MRKIRITDNILNIDFTVALLSKSVTYLFFPERPVSERVAVRLHEILIMIPWACMCFYFEPPNTPNESFELTSYCLAKTVFLSTHLKWSHHLCDYYGLRFLSCTFHNQPSTIKFCRTIRTRRNILILVFRLPAVGIF